MIKVGCLPATVSFKSQAIWNWSMIKYAGVEFAKPLANGKQGSAVLSNNKKEDNLDPKHADKIIKPSGFVLTAIQKELFLSEREATEKTCQDLQFVSECKRSSNLSRDPVPLKFFFCPRSRRCRGCTCCACCPSCSSTSCPTSERTPFRYLPHRLNNK